MRVISTFRRPALGLLCGLCLLTFGCGESVDDSAPTKPIDVQAAEKQVFSSSAPDSSSVEYVEELELESQPAVIQHLGVSADRDGDGRINQQEFRRRVTAWSDPGVSLCGVTISVRRGEHPLVGAQVTLMPAEFLSGSRVAATAVTDDFGACEPTSKDSGSLPGVRPGLYRVSVSLKDESGNETLPTRYTRGTVLSIEVAGDLPSSVDFDLSDK